MQVTQKAGVDGRLFGSVTNVDIVEALQALGHSVDKSMVRMPEGPLKHIGEFPITVALRTAMRWRRSLSRCWAIRRAHKRARQRCFARDDRGPATVPCCLYERFQNARDGVLE